MHVDKPTAVQILLAWRDNKWVVSRDTVEVGAYAYRAHAIDRIRTLAGEAFDNGFECYLLIRGPGGTWEERACPKPLRRRK